MRRRGPGSAPGRVASGVPSTAQVTRRAERSERTCGASPTKHTTPATAASAAAIVSAVCTASVTATAPVASARPAAAGITASAVRLAARAIALLTPDATLTCRWSAAAITVAVSGATNVTSPSPNTNAPGNTSGNHSASGPMRVRSSSPTAASSGPDRELDARTDALRERARRRRAHEHEHGDGQQRDARRERGPTRRDLQLVRHEEERDPERAVEQERRDVGDA